MVKDLLQSACKLGSYLLFKEKVQVIFYYPMHFNRSKNATNPYFDPILEACEREGITYLLLEEPGGEKGAKRNSLAVKADILFWIITVVRKIMPGEFSSGKECKVARIVNALTFGKLKVSNYVTISNSMGDLFCGINSKGHVYDMQHGIIFSGHPGYFKDESTLNDSYTNYRHHIWVWGDIYAGCFAEALPKDCSDKVIMTGYPMATDDVVNIKADDNRNILLFSLQLTADLTREQLQGSVEMLDEALDEAMKTDYEVYLKHHPRFNDVIDIDYLFTKYHRLKLTKNSLDELCHRVRLQITWSSTTAFEYAKYGIPTYFLSDKRLDWGEKIFYNQYCYPLYKGESLSNVLENIADDEKYSEHTNVVRHWYNSAYSPFDFNKVINLLKK